MNDIDILTNALNIAILTTTTEDVFNRLLLGMETEEDKSYIKLRRFPLHIVRDGEQYEASVYPIPLSFSDDLLKNIIASSNVIKDTKIFTNHSSDIEVMDDGISFKKATLEEKDFVQVNVNLEHYRYFLNRQADEKSHVLKSIMETLAHFIAKEIEFSIINIPDEPTAFREKVDNLTSKIEPIDFKIKQEGYLLGVYPDNAKTAEYRHFLSYSGNSKFYIQPNLFHNKLYEFCDFSHNSTSSHLSVMGFPIEYLNILEEFGLWGDLSKSYLIAFDKKMYFTERHNVLTLYFRIRGHVANKDYMRLVKV